MNISDYGHLFCTNFYVLKTTKTDLHMWENQHAWFTHGAVALFPWTPKVGQVKISNVCETDRDCCWDIMQIIEFHSAVSGCLCIKSENQSGLKGLEFGFNVVNFIWEMILCHLWVSIKQHVEQHLCLCLPQNSFPLFQHILSAQVCLHCQKQVLHSWIIWQKPWKVYTFS